MITLPSAICVTPDSSQHPIVIHRWWKRATLNTNSRELVKALMRLIL